MAKHRVATKSARRPSAVARIVAPGGLAAAAVGVTSLSSALMTGATTAVAPSVDLVALITPANSTSQIFAGTTYYGNDYADDGYGAQQVVPFFLGPQGIADAIRAADDADPATKDTVVLASGWGAGQTGTALGMLTKDQRGDLKLVILDNNTNRAGGGFWTTYSPFAPLLLTSAAPTPTNTGAPVLDVAYEYNINSDAPVDPLNPFALGNSLVAYVYGYGAQQTAPVPQAAIDETANPAGVHNHYVVSGVDENGDPIYTATPVSGTTTYVTFESDGLPLLRPLRLLPGGDIVADALEPTFTELVNAGYNDGKGIPGDEAIPQDPTVVRPMKPGSSLTGLGGVPGSVPTGFDAGVETAQEDVADPTSFVSKPIGEVGKLPVLSSVVDLPTTQTPEKSTSTLVKSPKKVSPDLGGDDDAPKSGSSGVKPAHRFTDRLNDAVKKVTGGLSGAHKDATKDSSDDDATAAG